MTDRDLQEYIKPVWGESPDTTSFKQSIRQVLEERDALLARVEAAEAQRDRLATELGRLRRQRAKP